MSYDKSTAKRKNYASNQFLLIYVRYIKACACCKMKWNKKNKYNINKYDTGNNNNVEIKAYR